MMGILNFLQSMTRPTVNVNCMIHRNSLIYTTTTYTT
ncbi:hypothetical protein DFP98_101173 [Cohnella phaseoli]|uniref:Uncharacterized protein n=1 Tax=Cohnella phaseoli TaxID=456490 RepID=A0A3D9KS09_9BACL|nr:hypothetical protein DFP98_101173 [Cohnella phaseoli]